MPFHPLLPQTLPHPRCVRVLLSLVLLTGACGDDSSPADGGTADAADDVMVDGNPADTRGDGSVCVPQSLVEPIWIAGASGTREELGRFGKPDAIFVLGDHLLAGDEDAAFEELHVFDLTSDDPSVMADALDSVIDLGADPGPGGAGELEFRGISGFAAASDGRLFVAEQGNDRLQVLRFMSGAYEHVAFLGQAAPNPDAPAPLDFVRLQALRVDSMDRLYVSDDGRDGTDIGRRDIQVFDNSGMFLFRFGQGDGEAFGVGANVQEPENFAIDEARDRIYVCDEGPNNVAVYRFSDRSFVRRFGDGIFLGTANGVDFDQDGNLYVVDEGNALTSTVRIFDPDTFEQIGQFGQISESSDLTPGTFNSPDTLIIEHDRDLVIVADQGHDRIQGFRLSDIRRAACL